MFWLVIVERKGHGEGAICTICGEGNEDCKHLFFHCSRIYRVWSWVRRCGGGSMLGPAKWMPILKCGFVIQFWDKGQLFGKWLSWRWFGLFECVIIGLSFREIGSIKMGDLNVVNSIWLGRLKSSGGGGDLVHSVADITRCPKTIKISRKPKKRNKHWVWTPPANEHIKVNVIGSLLGGSGRGRIEGLFRNSEEGGERVRFLFNLKKRWRHIGRLGNDATDDPTTLGTSGVCFLKFG